MQDVDQHVDVAAVDTALAVDIGGIGGGSLAQHDVSRAVFHLQHHRALSLHRHNDG